MIIDDLSLYIERLKISHKFSSYIDTVIYFVEYESDAELNQVVNLLNKKIKEEIRLEAIEMGLIKTDKSSSIFY